MTQVYPAVPAIAKLQFRALRKNAGTHKAGETRKAIQVGYTVPEGDAVTQAALGFVLESYIRGLVEDNADNWDFVPDGSSITLANWKVWNDTVAERKREVTSATLAAFGKIYAELAVSLLGKSPAQAAVGSQVIAQRLVKIIGNREVCAGMLANMEGIIAGAPSEVLEPHEACISWIISQLEAAVKVEVTADSL